MSADAKVWKDGEHWVGICDDEPECNPYTQSYYLSEVLRVIEERMGHRLRWIPRTYPKNVDGIDVGLSGYIS